MSLKSKPILIFMLFVLACDTEKSQNQAKSSETSDLRFNRFDQDLFTKGHLRVDDVDSFRLAYGNFFNIYTERILRIPPGSDSTLAKNLDDFVHNIDILEIYKKTKEVYPDVREEKDALADAFRKYKELFPERMVPRVVTFISGFNLSIACSDSVLGIGLDMYLGNDYLYYKQLGMPLYRTSKMSREYLASDAMKGWGQTEFEPLEPPADLLGQMIFRGKVLYFLDEVMPDVPDSIKIGYTAAQLEFCEEHERNIWEHFIGKKLLYSTDGREILKYTGEGPTTPGLPRESPAMIAAWTGWQMVKQYMKRNTGVTLADLMNEKDSRKILSLSKYKP